ncbi:thioredoxin domain-containing protein [Tsukamurella sp. 1534]|uniref:DsbA family protein n=1 Tax=Tsukamurella sp. 1534 TaxID=1151061 RepID=UPI000592D00A|nr:thioredoxin domain-containing protein [Tsukamurella sp. 1534]
MSKGKNAKYVPVKQSNTTTYVLGGIAILVVIVVVIGGVLLMSKKEGTPADQAKGKLDAATAVFVAGKQDAPVTLDFFEDPMCPACGAMEKQFGDQIIEAIEGGKVKVRYHLLSFLNGQSPSGDYSDRAGGALLAIAKSSLPEDQKQKAWIASHKAIFATQPAEGGQTDPSNGDLAKTVGDASKGAGAELPADVTDAVSQGKYTAESAKNAGEGSILMNDVGATGTPSVFKDGEKINPGDAGWLG